MRRAFLLASFLLSALAPTFSQTPQTGLYEFGPYDSLGIDTINRGNLNIHLTFPIFSRPGRGGSNFSFALNYDSLIWQPKSASGASSWSPASNWGWTTESNAEFGYVTFHEQLSPCTIGTVHYLLSTLTSFNYHDQFGKKHPFPYTFTGACNGPVVPTSGTGSYTTSDNSGYTIYRNANSYTAFSKTGEQYAIPAGLADINGYPVSPPTPAGTFTDPNGNQIIASGSGVFTDALGTTALTVTGTPTAGSVVYTYKDKSGTSRSVTVTYTSSTVATNFGVSGIGEDTGTSIPLITKIAYPDGSAYLFAYETTPGNLSAVTGRLAQITLPSGGTIAYAYSGLNNGIESDGSTSTLKRTTIDGTTTYARSGSLTAPTTMFTDATSAANTTVSTYLEDTNGYMYETSRSVYAGAATGTPLQNITTCYSQTLPCTTNSVTPPLNDIVTNVTQNGTLIVSDAKSYSGGFLIENNDGYIDEVTSYQGFTGPDGIGFARVSNVTDKLSTVQIAQTAYSYNSTVTSTSGVPNHVSVSTDRGNLVGISPWLNTTNATFGATTVAYWDTGSPKSSVNPNGTTAYGYEGTYSLMNSLIPPTPSSGVSLPTSGAYETSYTALPLSTTDPNGTKTTYANYDPLLRPTEIDIDDSGGNMVGKTTYSYPTSPSFNQEGVQQYQSSTTNSDTEVHLDSLGRPDRVALRNGQGTNPWYQQDTCFGANGLPSFRSYRYQGNGFSQGKVCSGAGDTYSYDALGRVTQIAHSDGSTIAYTYNGPAMMATDENGVSRITQSDGHGRITSVCEVSSATLQGVMPVSCGTYFSGKTGFITSYAYSSDANKNQVTTVKQGAQTQGAQTRTFVTDSLGRTVSVTEPERGTTSYTYAYNSTGLAVTRTRPKANQTSATVLTTTTTQYDALGRVLTITYSDGVTPNKNFNYDTNVVWSGVVSPTNPKGHLVFYGAILGSNTATWSGAALSYDAMGRVLNLWQCGPTTCGTGVQLDVGMGFAYDWTGNLRSWYDPASGQIGYGRSEAGEVTLISQGTYQGQTGNPANLMSNIVNGPNGPISYTLGNGLNAYQAYDGLGRLAGKWVCKGPANQGCSGGTQIYGTDVATRGSQVYHSNDTALAQQLGFGYDSMNRLTSVTNYGAAMYTYSYDMFGNRWTQTAVSGSGPQPSFTFNANNQITGTGYTYDAAGNMTQDGPISSGGHTYTYDAEGKILTVDNGTNGQYVYDAFNRRIWAQTSAATYWYLYDDTGKRTSSWLNPTAGNLGTGNEGRIYWGNQQFAYRSWYGTTYFEHQNYLGTERARTDYTGALAATFTSLPYGDASSAVIGGYGPDQDNSIFAGMDLDTNTSGAPLSDHAQFRNYSFTQGRWLAPDPYAGSYDFTNPQSFNRYAYVLNNPLTLTDPTGLHCAVGTGCGGGDCANDPNCGSPGVGGGGGGGGCDDASCGDSGGIGYDPFFGGSCCGALGGNDIALQGGNSWYTVMVNCGFNAGSCDTPGPADETIYVNCGGANLGDLSCLPNALSMQYLASGTQPYFSDASRALAYQITGEAGWIGTPEGVAAFYGASAAGALVLNLGTLVPIAEEFAAPYGQLAANAYWNAATGMRGWLGLGAAVAGRAYNNYQTQQPVWCLWCH
jgi:RHS repeat-associated protein